MELSLLLMHPLPAGLPRGEAIEFVGDVLETDLISGLMAIATAAEDEALA